MFIDGLWVSGMTLHIHRDGAPIPKEMQSTYIKMTLSPTQINAIAALLGLGYRNGELMYYKDDDLHQGIVRDDGLGFITEYKMMNDYTRQNRRSMIVADPIHSSHLMEDAQISQKSDGSFKWHDNDTDDENYDGEIEYYEGDDL
jgi:hypothetical protein